MGLGVKLRQITEKEAITYVREPACLIQEKRVRHEEFSRSYHVDFDFKAWDNAHKQRGYDWVVLIKALVSFDKVAHGLVVHGGQEVG
jgi:hypothetical protein